MFFLNSVDPTISESGTGSACYNLVPTSFFLALDVGAPPHSKPRKKRPGDEVVLAMQAISQQLQIGGVGGGGARPIFGYR